MGTLTAPACAVPRSATVHSTRVLPMSDTLSAGFTPRAMSPHAASSAKAANSAQVSGFHAPATLRKAATRCASPAARKRKRSATDRTPAKSSLSCCIEPIFFCAIAISSLRNGSVVRLPLTCAFLDPGFLGGIVAAGRRENPVDQLMRLVVLSGQPVQVEGVRQVQLGAGVVRVCADRDLEHFDRLLGITLRPGQLEEIPAPDDLRRAVEKVLVDAQRRQEPLAELALQSLRQRGEDADTFRVEADADSRVVVPAHVGLVGPDRLVRRLPRDLSLGGLALRSIRLAVRFPRDERCLAPVRLEPVGILTEVLFGQLLQSLDRGNVVALPPESVPLREPVRGRAGRRLRLAGVGNDLGGQLRR